MPKPPKVDEKPDEVPPPPKVENQKMPSCTRCGKRDAEPGGNWCGPCREAAAAYQRGYRSADEIRARALGIREMREFLVDQFERLGSGSFTGEEIAYIIRNTKFPPPSEQPAEGDRGAGGNVEVTPK